MTNNLNTDFDNIYIDTQSDEFENYDISKNPKPYFRKRNKPPLTRFFIFAIIILLLISTIIGSFIFYYGYNKPYVKVFKTAINAVVEYDWENYSSVLSDELKKKIGSKLGSPEIQTTEQFMGVLHNFYFKSYGNNVTVKMDQIACEKISFDDAKKFQDDYNNYYDSNVKINQLFKIQAVLTVTGDNKTRESNIEVYIPKINNKWVLTTPYFI